MSDALRPEEQFERDLREVLAAMAPPSVPRSVRTAVSLVPREVSARRIPAWRRTRSLLAGLAAAATTLLLLAGLVIVVAHPFGLGRLDGTGPGTSSPSPSATPGAPMRDEYQVMSSGGRQPTADDLDAIAAIVTNRLQAMGVASPEVSVTAPDRLVVMLPAEDPGAMDLLRQVIGTTGRVDFVPLGSSSVELGATLSVETLGRTCPTVDSTSCVLFSGDQIADATAGADQTGNPSLDFVLRPAGAASFADYSSAHVGDTFALVLDGTVVAAPTINEAITEGRLTIALGVIGGARVPDARRLAAILGSGALPYPLQEVSFGP